VVGSPTNTAGGGGSRGPSPGTGPGTGTRGNSPLHPQAQASAAAAAAVGSTTDGGDIPAGTEITPRSTAATTATGTESRDQVRHLAPSMAGFGAARAQARAQGRPQQQTNMRRPRDIVVNPSPLGNATTTRTPPTGYLQVPGSAAAGTAGMSAEMTAPHSAPPIQQSFYIPPPGEIRYDMQAQGMDWTAGAGNETGMQTGMSSWAPPSQLQGPPPPAATAVGVKSEGSSPTLLPPHQTIVRSLSTSQGEVALLEDGMLRHPVLGGRERMGARMGPRRGMVSFFPCCLLV
jgi:hypothetical protein